MIVLPRPKKFTEGHAVVLAPDGRRAVSHSDIIVADSANDALRVLQLTVPVGAAF